MNHANKQKMGKRLLAVVISILATVAVMGVGVFASTSNFSVQVENKVDIHISTVNGVFSARRGGDVIYGNVSLGDNGKDTAGYGPRFANTDDIVGKQYPLNYETALADESGKYLVIYDNLEETYLEAGYRYHTANKAEIEKPVNFYLSAKDEAGNPKQQLTIYYVFKFDFMSESPQDVQIKITDGSTPLLDKRAEFVSIDFKYVQGDKNKVEPTDWSTVPNMTGDMEIKVDHSDVNTHMTYIYAGITVQRTNSLNDAYTLGYQKEGEVELGEKFEWSFAVNLEPLNTI